MDTTNRRILAGAALAILLSAAAGAAPSTEPIRIASWRVVGPFEVGSREGFVNHLAAWDGTVPERFTYEETYPSALVAGGRAAWKAVEAERDDKGELTGRVAVSFPDVDWDSREDEWGGAGVFNAAYAAGSFTLERDQLLVLDASRCSVTIAGVSHAGDPYGAGIARSVVRGRAGVNTVLVASAGFGGERAFELTLTPVDPNGPAVVILEKDVLVPDIVVGASSGGRRGFLMGVPLLNLTDEWQRVEVEVTGALKGGAQFMILSTHGPPGPIEFPRPLAPLAAVKIPVHVGPAMALVEPGEQPIVLTVRAAGREDKRTLNVRVVGPKEARRETFKSQVDGSVQARGVLPAQEEGPEPLALVMSTHGAGVDALGQVRAHAPKTWARVVAPMNRRPYGFDWHDWGRLDFEEVVRRELPSGSDVDRDRVSLVGHSMGGHGAWILGAQHADEFASVTPSAGWIGYDTYMPPTLRRSQNFADARLASFWLRGIAGTRVSPLLENLINVPVRALHGGADDNVPPTHARILVGALAAQGGDATLREVPGKGHWWDEDEERPGADCVDSVELEEVWRTSRRVHFPKRVVFVTVDPDVDRDMYWVELLEQRSVATESRIEAEVASRSHVRVTTRNVRRFALDLAPELVDAGRVEVEVNGRALVARVGEGGGGAVIEEREGRWVLRLRGRLSRPYLGALSPNERPGSYAKALFEPFLVVVGTQGDAARTERLLDVARTLTHAWWVRANGTASIVRDTDLTDALRDYFNLVLVGGPDANLETRARRRELLVVATGEGVTLAGRRIAGKDLACAHWQKNPARGESTVLVLQATSAAGDRLLGALNPIGAGHGLPDYVVATPAVRAKSWGGFAACGWWTPDFRFDPENAWLAGD